MDKKPVCCIYKIINIHNGKYYLGSTQNFDVRVKRHKKELRNNKHHCIHLQRAYNKYGEKSFTYEIILECSVKQRIKIEQNYLNKMDYNKCYNVSKSASGGNLIENHPNKSEIIKRATDVLLKENKKPENIARNKSLVGSKNPNYGNRWSKKLKNKVSKIVKKRYKNMTEEEKLKNSMRISKEQLQFWASEKGKKQKNIRSEKMTGKGNHFYGKKHKKSSLKKIGAKNKGKKNINCWVKVTIEGVNYESITEASKKLKISTSNLNNRLNSTNPKFANWNYYGKTKEIKEIKNSKSIKYKAKDRIYDSITEASRELKKSTSALVFRAKSKDPKWADYSFVKDNEGKKK